MSESLRFGGQPVRGFALADAPAGASPVLAAVMTGATVGLLVHVCRGPAWGAIAAGVGATLLTKFGIDKAGA